jgi:uncharacterized membrane protein YcfT
MSDPNTTGTQPDPAVDEAARTTIDEDWAATIVGLGLLLLVLLGLIGKGTVP